MVSPSHSGTGDIRSDELIGGDAVQSLARDESIEAGEVLVEVKDGQVTLTGEVPQRDMVALAEQCVSALPGVRGVRNLIRYDDGADSFGPPGAAVRGLDPDESTGPTEAPKGVKTGKNDGTGTV
ncbi:MAG TPA: BON domain-containing protein [Stenotrophomonas sp.]|jgi:hypothetical protein